MSIRQVISALVTSLSISCGALAQTADNPTRVGNGYLYCPATNFSASEMTDALNTTGMGRNSSAVPTCMYGATGRAESRGNTCLRNLSGDRSGMGCCIGAFQVHRMHLAQFGYTPATFANASLQEQARVYAVVAEQNASSRGYSTLVQMRNDGQTFDGRPITDGMLLACSQFGARVCNGAVTSGSCTGGADEYGSNICSFGASIERHRTPGCGNNQQQAQCDPTPGTIGPGDFPTTPTPVSSAAPAPSSTDINVGANQI